MTKVTEAYARLVARDTCFWAWPLVNLYMRRLGQAKVPAIARLGPAPVAPLNRLSMLTDYIDPEERLVACPNQDVVYGAGALALDLSPVVLQVPDFADRFWMYQVVDSRTDSFARLGKMYATRPGFYLLAGPEWNGEVPRGISEVFRASTRSGSVIPRIFVDDTADDKKTLQAVLSGIMMYPLAEYDATAKTMDWDSTPRLPAMQTGDTEVRQVDPATFFDVLPEALIDAPARPGEEALYARITAVLDAAAKEPELKAAMCAEAEIAERDLIAPLFEFRNYGIALPHHWTTIKNGAAFGTDYFTRTAVARSNIFVNSANETAYFYQDLDANGRRLDGVNRYKVTFAPGATPPVDGFWSLTLYNQHHFFEPNEIHRYSTGTKNKSLQYNPDGSLTIHVQAAPAEPRENWLPAPARGPLSLYIRAYWPRVAVRDGSWSPPPVSRNA